MFRIHNKNIYLTRGDSAIIELKLKQDGVDYALHEGDVCVLTVKRSIASADILLQKNLADWSQFYIAPDDTAGWEYGEYIYDVQVTTAAGDVFTVVTPHKFIIKEEVTLNV